MTSIRISSNTLKADDFYCLWADTMPVIEELTLGYFNFIVVKYCDSVFFDEFLDKRTASREERRYMKNVFLAGHFAGITQEFNVAELV